MRDTVLNKFKSLFQFAEITWYYIWKIRKYYYTNHIGITLEQTIQMQLKLSSQRRKEQGPSASPKHLSGSAPCISWDPCTRVKGAEIPWDLDLGYVCVAPNPCKSSKIGIRFSEPNFFSFSFDVVALSSGNIPRCYTKSLSTFGNRWGICNFEDASLSLE